ncbi:hypothetical protein LJR164_001642 [Phenylobacterium sp. LjRoot164]|uniref:hypothetical protein n=1 Tax=unclassified Phenylobacterium TaxID=2640670 RepID=UPI003ECFE061
MAWPDDIAVLDANDVERAIKTPNPNGPADEADSAPVVLSTQDRGLLGALTETAPTTDTASAGLNGRLQRLAQRATSLIALFPTSIGAKARNASLGVALATEDRAALDALATEATQDAVKTAVETVAEQMLSEDPAAVNEVPSAMHYTPVAGTAKYLVTGSPGVLTNYFIYNPHATDTLSVQLFDKATTAAVTLGTDVPAQSFPLGPKQGANVAGLDLNFGVGIVMAAIKDLSGSTAPTTGAVVNLGFRAP